MVRINSSKLKKYSNSVFIPVHILILLILNSSSWTANDAATGSVTSAASARYEHGKWKSWQPNEPNESKHDARYNILHSIHFVKPNLCVFCKLFFFSSTKSVTAATNAIYACSKYEPKQYANITYFTYAPDNKFTIVIAIINVTTFITFIIIVNGWPTKPAHVRWTKKCARNESTRNDESTWSKHQSKHATLSITAPSANAWNVTTGIRHNLIFCILILYRPTLPLLK